MADFDKIIKEHVGEDGNVPGSAISTIVSDIKKAVGEEFVSKERYTKKLNEIETLKEEKNKAEDENAKVEQYKKKYEDEKAAFEAYKAEQDAKTTRESKQKAYTDLLKETGIADKWLGRAVKGVDFDSLELDKDGKIKDADKLKETIKSEWGDCIVSEGAKGADTATPPANDGREGGKGPSRAAKIAQKYHEDLYGKLKEE